MKNPNLDAAIDLLAVSEAVQSACLKILVQTEDLETRAMALSEMIGKIQPIFTRDVVSAVILWDPHFAPFLVRGLVHVFGRGVKQGWSLNESAVYEAIFGLIQADLLIDHGRKNPGTVLPASIIAMAYMSGIPVSRMPADKAGLLANELAKYLTVAPEICSKGSEKLRQFVCKVSAGQFEAARILEIHRGELPLVAQLALEFGIKSRALFVHRTGICNWIQGNQEALRLYTNSLGTTPEELGAIFQNSHQVVAGSVWMQKL